MSSSDIEYYRDRALMERALSKASNRQGVAEIHAELARLYEALVEQEELRSKLKIVVPDRLSA